MFYDILENLCSSKGKSVFAVTSDLNITASTVSYWKKKGTAPKGATLAAIAKYFDVSVDYLLGKTSDRNPEKPNVTDDDIKFALFGGATEVTDEMYEDVKRFAKFLIEKEKKENGET